MPRPEDSILQHLLKPEASPEGDIKLYQYKRPWKAPPFLIKLMKLEIYKLMNISMSPKIMQKGSKLNVFCWKHSNENNLFHFDCYSEGNALIGKSPM